MSEQPARRANRRRQSATKTSRSVLADQLAWEIPTYLNNPIAPLSDEHVQAIHDMSLRVLEEIGILFLNDEALRRLDEAGCDVDWETKNEHDISRKILKNLQL